ncbi:3,4-dioxygenase subunit beta [Actinophytocola sp.]|uniref:3,4-dioxygenase subunit beta n=1 Tax=Actinophytocola sp. TaxID=1872138 RepID=UPI002D23DA1D|nr:3,4-dioxygenase subunit beta [Actinophytocola sp.]HYQ67803.1 3,4-dioxygenase subunit beta [Actinophytocola sp.]
MERDQNVPGYQGRVLVRSDEEIVDQGLGFDVGTILSRRRVLRVLGIGAAAAGVATCSTAEPGGTAATTTAATTTAANQATVGEMVTASTGPDVLEQSGIVRSDIRASFGGAGGVAGDVPMTLELTVADLAGGGSAFAGVAVYVWHCDRDGGYSMYSDAVRDENYLRGVQIADAAGKVPYTSIFPACYAGRWPHIHFEVYPGQADITDPARAIATSQVALPGDVCATVYAEDGYARSVTNLSRVSLDSDNVFGDDVFGDDGGVSQLGTVTGDVASGYTVTLDVAFDTTG